MAKLEVFDKQRLRQQLEQRSIRFLAHQSEYCWAYQLIARGARMIRDGSLRHGLAARVSRLEAAAVARCH